MEEDYEMLSVSEIADKIKTIVSEIESVFYTSPHIPEVAKEQRARIERLNKLYYELDARLTRSQF